MSLEFSASFVDSAFALMWQASVQASVLIGLVLGLLLVFRKLSSTWRILLLAIVFVRLLIPITPESRFSVFNLWQEKTTFTKQQGTFDERILLPREAVSKQQGMFVEPTLLLHENSILEKPRVEILWSRIASVIWFGGVVLILGVAATRQFRLNRGLVLSSQPWRDEQKSCFKRLGMRRRKPLPVFVSSRMNGPAIAGLLRPRLILPANFAGAFSESELHAILLHELAHLKRKDLLWNGLTFLVATLHWMNPLVWIVARGFRRDLELACDATVLKEMKSEERSDYGRTLLRVAEMISRPAERMTVLAAPFSNSNSNLKDRIQMIVNPKKTSVRGVLAMAGAVIILCLGTFTSATADDEKSDSGADKKVERVTVTSGLSQILATADKLEKLGLGREAAEYRAKASGLEGRGRLAAVRDIDQANQDGDRKRPAEVRGGDQKKITDRERDRPAVRDVPERRVERDGDGDVLERLRRLEAENKKLRAEVERLRKGRD